MLKEIKTRLKHESPDFFKKIQKTAITIGSIGGGILLIPTSMVVLPAALVTVAGYMAACGFVAAFVAKTPVSDPSVLKKDEEPKDNV